MSEENGEWTEVHDDTAFDEGHVVDAEIVPFEGTANVDLDTVPPLNFDEAKALTENIRATADVLYVLIQRAHAGKAWEPLGYTSFESYVREEFDISRSRAYQLLNQANVIQQIESAAPEGTKVNINEATVRDLKGVMDTLLPSISEATEGMSPDEASSLIDSMLSEAREEQRDAREEFSGGDGESYDEEYAGDRADRDGFSSNGGGYSGGEGGYGGGQNGNVDTYAPEDGDFDDDEELPDLFAFEEDSDPMATRQRLESVYNLYSALSSMQTMPSPQDMVDFIPEERRVQVDATLAAAVEWLNAFSQAWNSQEWSVGGNVNNDENSDASDNADDNFASQVNASSDDGENDVFADIHHN